VQRQLFRLLSRDIGRAALLAGDWSADQRMAAFLIGLSRRLSERGFSANRFQLTMARTDIANYLRLAPETVSRVLRRFDDDHLLRIERRDVELLDRDALMALAAPVLRHRLLLSFAAEAEQKSPDDVVAALLRSVPLGA